VVDDTHCVCAHTSRADERAHDSLPERGIYVSDVAVFLVCAHTAQLKEGRELKVYYGLSRFAEWFARDCASEFRACTDLILGTTYTLDRDPLQEQTQDCFELANSQVGSDRCRTGRLEIVVDVAP